MYTRIVNAKIVTPEKIIPGDIIIGDNGKITEINPVIPNLVRDDNKNDAFDAQGKYTLPGLIEIHGHMREPGFEQKEDVPHGTSAAVAGGFTTIIDMPNTNPPTTSVELLKTKLENIYPGRSYTDYAFFMGVAKDSLSELEKVNTSDIAGIKVFMAGHETSPSTIPDDKTLGKVFAIAGKRNILLAVHAEDQGLIDYYNNELKKTGRTDPLLWSELRPKEVVIKAAKRALFLAEKYRTKLYLLHLSTPEELALVESAKQKGLTVFGEIVSYQLVFTTSDYKRLGNKIKVAPSLRDKKNQDELWGLFRKGKADVVCSEHTPHEFSTKNQLDVWKAQSGMPNIQETLPALITGWIEHFGKNNLEEGLMTIAKTAASNPANIFGFDTKGEIAPNKDADLTIIDPQKQWRVKKEDIFSKCGWSPYEGMTLFGRPIATFLRGNLVYNNGRIIGKPQGNFLRKI